MSMSGGVSYAFIADVLAPYALNNLEDAATMYIGKAQRDGKWLVQKFVQATGDMSYANASNNAYGAYADAWANRATLNYGAFQALTGV
jgi:hypothetical protein